MTLSAIDIGHVLLAISCLLASSHAFSYLFRRFRQPQVIGEICGGLILGPSFLQAVSPGAYAYLFSINSPTKIVLGCTYQLGLFLLMFCSGLEMRSNFKASDRKVTAFITAFGTFIPFIASFFIVRFFDVSKHLGPSGTTTAFTLVFAIAIAITSIPVISRILADLGVLNTTFSKIILSSAVIEDVVLYVVLTIALSLGNSSSTGSGEGFGVISMFKLSKNSGLALGYHMFISSVFFGASLLFGPFIFQKLDRLKLNLLRKSSPLAFLLVIMLLMTLTALFFGIAPMLGAFAAGLIARNLQDDAEKARDTIKGFSFSFFIPIYFAIVGLRLDLLHSFDIKFFLGFLLIACFVKVLCVYWGARFAGESKNSSFNFAVAMNARGGPGIVLASLAFDAGIVNEAFYACLVMLAILTSLFAGSWLGWILHSGRPLRN